jgi:wyosine [tRNA(Phe)-imidazoG37] synthetase (radical SAM superfamily)
MVLPIKKSIIYGPVNSRRLGASLGVNLMPHGRKYCDFDCLYCHYGRTTDHRRYPEKPDLFPETDIVLREVENWLRSDVQFGYLTFSGNGEPTLHPRFAEIARGCRDLARKLRPDVKVTLLSNSSTCTDPGITAALSYIDLPIMKLDAGDPGLFDRINRPAAGIKFEDILAGLVKLEDITIQTLFLTGDPDNSTPAAVASWLDRLETIKPEAVQIYTLDRPFARKAGNGIVRIRKVPDSRMAEIVAAGKERGLRIERY